MAKPKFLKSEFRRLRERRWDLFNTAHSSEIDVNRRNFLVNMSKSHFDDLSFVNDSNFRVHGYTGFSPAKSIDFTGDDKPNI